MKYSEIELYICIMVNDSTLDMKHVELGFYFIWPPCLFNLSLSVHLRLRSDTGYFSFSIFLSLTHHVTLLVISEKQNRNKQMASSTSSNVHDTMRQAIGSRNTLAFRCRWNRPWRELLGLFSTIAEDGTERCRIGDRAWHEVYDCGSTEANSTYISGSLVLLK